MKFDDFAPTTALQRLRRRTVFLTCAGLLMAAAGTAGAAEVQLADLDLSKLVQEFGHVQANKSVSGHPLTINGRVFERGVGSHAASSLQIKLDGRATGFHAFVGIDDEVKGDPKAKNFPIEIRVMADGHTVFKSGPMRAGDAGKAVDVDLNGVKNLVLYTRLVGSGNMFAHADWADAKITYDGDKPETVSLPPDEAVVLTPLPAKTPRMNFARVLGVRPGKPVLFRVATTGERPITFTGADVPDGVKLDPATGILTGAIAKAGTYRVKLSARNALGSAEQTLTIEAGDRIALTPPMGWNSWNCFAHDVSDEKVRAAADAMEKSGLIDHGWTYINIDDCWQLPVNTKAPEKSAQPLRDANGRVRTNDKFQDMKALTDYLHAKGLKAGIYSSPGPWTCAHFTGSYENEAADAKQYAEWGFDYLKYDWCSYGGVANQLRKLPNRPPEATLLRHPYEVMRDELAKQDRDIVYSLCQYGMGSVWEWGGQVGGNCWRTTDDIGDSWGSVSAIGFNQHGLERFAKPGQWNDPDMLVLGKVGWGPKLHQTKLTPSEQYSHVSLWSLLAAPLLIGCDLTQLDAFTTGLLSNDEVIAINQDPLGKQGSRVAITDDDGEIWV
ncbi:MAG: alpha-galactosidase, partial [Phycisphaerales bacterium]|nr:alpha-galactosidase [Phycisphaerales bacterium]